LRNYESKNKTNEILSYENQTAEEKEQLISDMVDKELDLIGIGKHLAGREYIHTAICYLILHQGQDDQEPTIKYLSSVYKKPASTISRNMQNAIISAWRISAIEDLEKYYTARINVHTGVPTPNEFIYYYVDKIKKMI
jgi:hypothetical protein